MIPSLCMPFINHCRFCLCARMCSVINSCYEDGKLPGITAVARKILTSLSESQGLDLKNYAIKLQSSLEIDAQKVNELIKFIKEIWSICVYSAWKTSALEAHLRDLGVENDHIIASFLDLWTKQGPKIISQLKNKACCSTILQDVQYEVGVDICCDRRLAVNKSMATLNLHVNHDGNQKIVPIELDHQDAMKLFDALQNVQIKLDSITS